MRAPARLPACALVLLAAAGSHHALEDLPSEGGWTGYLLAGAGAGAVRSNEIAGSVFSEIGDAEIDSLGRPADLEREVVPVVSGELGYFFKGTGTHVVLGNVLEDLIRYDFSTSLGVRQDMGSRGILAVELLASGSPARVYRDPFVTGEERETVNRTSTGTRITWDRIGGSALELELTARAVRLEDEGGGEALGLGRARRRALDREGFLGRIRAGYRLPLHPRHLLEPRVGWSRFGLDGRAEAHDRISLELLWRFMSRHLVATTEILLARSRYDATHPVFGEKREDSLKGLLVTGFFPTVFRSRSWALSGTVGVYDGSSSIAFYDTRVSLASAVVMLRF